MNELLFPLNFSALLNSRRGVTSSKCFVPFSKIHRDVTFFSPANLHGFSATGVLSTRFSRTQRQTQNDTVTLLTSRPQVVLQFSFERKRGEEAPRGGRSKWKGDKQVKTKRNTYPGTAGQGEGEERKIGECLFFVDVGSFIPSNYSSSVGSSRLHSIVFGAPQKVPKHAPSRPTSTRLLFHPPPGSKMKIGWCSREIRGGRARLGGGRRSSRSRELSTTCVICVCTYAVCASTALVDYRRRRYFNACHTCPDICRSLSLSLRNKMHLFCLTIELAK